MIALFDVNVLVLSAPVDTGPVRPPPAQGTELMQQTSRVHIVATVWARRVYARHSAAPRFVFGVLIIGNEIPIAAIQRTLPHNISRSGISLLSCQLTQSSSGHESVIA